MSNILAATIEVQQEEIAELREQLAAARLKTDEACKTVQVQFKRNGQLEQRLAAVAALVPETDWLEMVAVAQDYFKPGCHKYCPMADGDGNCSLQCDSIVIWATVLADRIRAWRGDGGEERGGESDASK